MGMLREYIKFRNHVLGGKKFDKLFLFFPERVKTGVLQPSNLSVQFQAQLFKSRLSGKYIDISFENITPTMTRKYKSVALHELGIALGTVSKVMGHSERTNQTCYSEGTPEKAMKQFSLFWKAVAASAKKAAEQSIIATDNETIKTTEIASGACRDIGNPISNSDDPPVVPDCKTQFGCLYCEHYSCHADEEDAHRLLSLIYVLTEVREQSKNNEHADSLLRETCVRARFVIDEIREASEQAKKMVGDLEKKVFELGILTAFWEMRLSRYEKMGVLIINKKEETGDEP